MSPHGGGAAIDVPMDESKPSTICKNCDRDFEVHMVDGKCPFEACSFEPYIMKDLIDKTLEGMGPEFNKHTHQTVGGPTKPHGS